jgi:hypothetical protein
MTRSELFEKLLKVAPLHPVTLHDRHRALSGLKELGLIEFVEKEDMDFLGARDCLAGRAVDVGGGTAVLTLAGAFSLLDALRHNGYRIVS